MANWRVQWRTMKRRTLKGTTLLIPDEIKHEDNHTLDTARGRVADLMNDGVCWLWIENLDSPHKGNSSEKPKAHKR